MQPTVSFEKGFCNFDCTVCSDVCPNGAIPPLTVEQKHLTQMGYVVFIEENCIVLTDGTSCGACSEHCPTQAIAMVPYKDGLTLPTSIQRSASDVAAANTSALPARSVPYISKETLCRKKRNLSKNQKNIKLR